LLFIESIPSFNKPEGKPSIQVQLGEAKKTKKLKAKTTIQPTLDKRKKRYYKATSSEDQPIPRLALEIN
jgi:hypothetical protein